jgi:hypothetical protein
MIDAHAVERAGSAFDVLAQQSIHAGTEPKTNSEHPEASWFLARPLDETPVIAIAISIFADPIAR